jgi:Cdc6-like AAA superfamily ATPase
MPSCGTSSGLNRNAPSSGLATENNWNRSTGTTFARSRKFCIQSSASTRAETVFEVTIGFDTVGSVTTSDARFDVDLNELTDILIQGTTGSGKTTTMMRLLEQATRLTKVHRLLGLPQLPLGVQRYMAAAMPLEGDLPKRAGATIINARSITEALTEAVETFESGSVPGPGEPTYL